MSMSPTETRGYTAVKGSLLNRLRRIEGQVRGVGRMIDQDRYCIDVLTQLGAVRSALDGVSLGLLDGHVRHCLAKGGQTELDAKAEEVVGAIRGRGGRLRHTADKRVLRERVDHAGDQVGRVIEMVEADRYCIDVLNEISGAKKTLDAVALGLVDAHIRSCMTSGALADDNTRELIAAVARLVKST
jgi:CsoR family transcriptional regulator, copper-sensing transcriptional repressor